MNCKLSGALSIFVKTLIRWLLLADYSVWLEREKKNVTSKGRIQDRKMSAHSLSPKSESESFLVMSNSLHTGQNTGVGSLSLLQVIFPTQGLNPGLPHCRQILYQLSHREAQYFEYMNTWIGPRLPWITCIVTTLLLPGISTPLHVLLVQFWATSNEVLYERLLF